MFVFNKLKWIFNGFLIVVETNSRSIINVNKLTTILLLRRDVKIQLEWLIKTKNKNPYIVIKRLLSYYQINYQS